MYVDGRWLKLEVVDAMLISWGILVLIIVGGYFWFKRSLPPSPKQDQDSLPGNGRKKKRSGRKKRYRE